MAKASIEEFIHGRNIENYRRRLTEPLQPTDRATILKLLAAEEAKQAMDNGSATAATRVLPLTDVADR